MGTVYAIDFDDFISQCDNVGQPPVLENLPNVSVVEWMRDCHDKGIRLVVHTSRKNPDGEKLIEYLRYYRIPFDDIKFNKVSALKYFGNNYFNTVLDAGFDRNLDKSNSEYFNVLRNYRDEVYYILQKLESNSSLSYMISQFCDRDSLVSYKTAIQVFIAGNGGCYGIAQMLTHNLNSKIGSDRIFAYHLGSNPVTLSNGLNVDLYKNDFISISNTKITRGGKRKSAGIIFTPKIDKGMIESLFIEMTTYPAIKIYYFTSDPSAERLFSDFHNTKVITIKSENLFVVENVFLILSNMFVNVLQRVLKGELKISQGSFTEK